MRERLAEKGALQERMTVIPNWVDTTKVVPQPKDNDWARTNGLSLRPWATPDWNRSFMNSGSKAPLPCWSAERAG